MAIFARNLYGISSQ